MRGILRGPSGRAVARAASTRLLVVLALLVLLLAASDLRSAFAEETTIGRVAITSVDDSSFAVSWITDQPADGYLLYGTDPNRTDQWKRVDDVRGSGYQGFTHYVSVENADPGPVTPSTTYYFSVTSTRTTVLISGQSALAVKTGAALAGQAPEPNFFSGSVRYQDASPAAGVLVFVTLRRVVSGQPTETSQQLSGLTDSSGAFSIDVGRARVATSGAPGDYFRLSTTSADEKISYEIDAGTGNRLTGTADGNTTSAGTAAPVQPRVISLAMLPPAPLPTPSPTSALIVTPPPPLEQTVTPAVATPRPSPSPTPPRVATATPLPPTPVPGTLVPGTPVLGAPSPLPATPTEAPTPAATVVTPVVTPTVAAAPADASRVPPSILAVIGAAVLLITTGLALTAVGLFEGRRR